jgi:amino acid adenylation domain-containing protein
LGVARAGGAYVPLDPGYPAERLAYILEDSRAPVLLTRERLRGVLPVVANGAARVVSLDEGWEESLPGLVGDLEPGAGPESQAYAIYTSGSTGRPKGVQVPHRGLVSFLASMARRPGFAAGDVMVAVTPISFDIAALELYLPLAAGGRVVIASRETAADGARLAALLAGSGATALQGTPATWGLLLGAGWRGSAGLAALCGGEALPPALAADLLPRVGSLWNLYGPTETTVWSAVEGVRDAARISLGRPIGNTRLHLLDRAGDPVPAGVPGELLIGGAGLARGYLGRPDLTAERFVPDPFGSLWGEPGGRLYRTGDLARFRPDGTVEYLGRIDHQIKLRGFRIELGEIEAALRTHPAVGESAVVVREDRPGDRRLVAYSVAREERPGVEDLRLFLRERLPEPMVPSLFVFLERLPLTPNGKVDRRSLPTPEADRPELAVSFVSPQSETERAVAAIWQEVLGLERVGIHDNFFDLGGHSLLAAEVHGKLQARLQADVTLVELLQYPTVHALASRLRRGSATTVAAVEPAQGMATVQDMARREREAVQRRRKAALARRGGVA